MTNGEPDVPGARAVTFDDVIEQVGEQWTAGRRQLADAAARIGRAATGKAQQP